jgi:hypothetical protein
MEIPLLTQGPEMAAGGGWERGAPNEEASPVGHPAKSNQQESKPLGTLPR